VELVHERTLGLGWLEVSRRVLTDGASACRPGSIVQAKSAHFHEPELETIRRLTQIAV
jgi:hypothetical protein